MSAVVVGISGASGAAVAVAALELLHEAGREVHLVVSKWGAITLEHECGIRPRDLHRWVSTVHNNADLTAPIASGTFPVEAMLVVPCSARTLATIAHGTGDTLLARTADVTLKERRRLVLGLREAPLSTIHLQSALTATQAGATVYPLVPSFYTKPTGLDALTRQIAARLVDACGIVTPALSRWGEDIDLTLRREPGA